jgi:hypothetical protein
MVTGNNKKVQLTYIGKRFWNDRLVQVFTDNKGGEVSFKGVKYLRIGLSYHGTRSDTGLTIPAVPEELKSVEVDEEKVAQWEVEETLAEHMANRKRHAVKYSRDKRVFQELLPQLKKLTKNLSYVQKKLLIEALIERCD